jgi:hypothetical protein
MLYELLANRRSKLADGDSIQDDVEEDLEVLLSPANERNSLCAILSL